MEKKNTLNVSELQIGCWYHLKLREDIHTNSCAKVVAINGSNVEFLLGDRVVDTKSGYITEILPIPLSIFDHLIGGFKFKMTSNGKELIYQQDTFRIIVKLKTVKNTPEIGSTPEIESMYVETDKKVA
jgi:hypothetical protein